MVSPLVAYPGQLDRVEFTTRSLVPGPRVTLKTVLLFCRPNCVALIVAAFPLASLVALSCPCRE